ncbi:unnamed protein product [Soboliphyme baturini]|uniref:UCH domain-containing protein n=1 Tax=Soboliphyme baturini TaxID=241478 RepID=A0A183IYF9_9BILA|nr:unnamed protein product [Soboliphyme baturini]
MIRTLHVSVNDALRGITSYTEERSLQSLFERFLDEDVVAYKCEKCHGDVATMRHEIRSFPRFIIMSLKRYCFDAILNDVRKNERSVFIPKYLKVSAFAVSGQEKYAPYDGSLGANSDRTLPRRVITVRGVPAQDIQRLQADMMNASVEVEGLFPSSSAAEVRVPDADESAVAETAARLKTNDTSASSTFSENDDSCTELPTFVRTSPDKVLKFVVDDDDASDAIRRKTYRLCGIVSHIGQRYSTGEHSFS